MPEPDTDEPEDAKHIELDDEGPDYDDADEGTLRAFLIDQIDNINLARDMTQEALDTIGQDVVREYNIDKISRAEWKDNAEKALAFATQEAEEKQYPWPKASNTIFPLITQAALAFGARTYPAIIQNRNVVKGIVWGSDKGTPMTDDGTADGQPKMDPNTNAPVWLVAPGEKRNRADRIGEHMSWQLLEEMPEWEPQTDQLLHQIPIIGGAMRKTYRDPAMDRNFSLFVSLLDVVWNYHAASFEAAPRVTEILSIYPNQIEEYERADEMFLPMENGYGAAGGDSGTEDDDSSADMGDPSAPHTFLEQHRLLDLDGDGYEEPYVVTVHERSGKVVRIVARYDEEGIRTSKNGETVLRIDPNDQYTLIPFLPNLDGGSYPMGFGHLLRPLNEAINTTLNQMFDAGHLANAGGGFISDQLSIRSGTVQFQVGRYMRVGSKGQDIREAVMPLPFKGPDATLFQLLGLLVTSGKEIASIQDILTGGAEMANAPPTTILALIEQGMKLYTAIHKRVYRALKSEFQKLYRLNRLYLTEDQRYRVGDEWREIKPEDYRLGGGVEPIADPTMITDMQKLGRAAVGMQFKDDPMINQVEIRRRLFEAAQMDRIDELFAPPPQPNPMAPVMMQLELQEKQVEISRTRAAEMKDQTQAFLNLALARAKADGPQIAWIDAQLEFLRFHIESANTMIKAAAVQVKAHDVESKRQANAASHAAKSAHRAAGADSPAARTPVPGDDAGGLPDVAPQPDNGGLPPVPPGPEGGIPAGGGGPLGGGQPPLGG